MQRSFGILVAALVAVLRRSCGAEVSVECPLGAEGCLEEEVTALLQLATTRQDLNLDLGAATTKQDLNLDLGTACPSKGVQAYITQLALDYLAQEVFPINLVNVSLPIAPISGNLSGTTYSVHIRELQSFQAGYAALDLVANEGLAISIGNVSLQLSLTYALGVNMFGASIPHSGTAVVDIRNTSIAMKVIFGLNEKGNPSVHAQVLSVNFGLHDVTFTGPTPPPVTLSSLGDMWTGLCQPLVKAAAETTAKSVIESFKLDVAETLAQFLANSTLPLKNTTEPHPYEILVQACDFEVAEGYLALNAFVRVNTSGGGAPHPAGSSGYDLSSLEGYQVVTSQMLGVAASEWTIDGLLWLVRRSAGLLSLLAAEPPAPLRLKEHPGLLPDGRDLQAVAEANTKKVVEDPTLRSSLLPQGLELTETKVRFFNQAVAALFSFSLNVPALVASLLPKPPAPQ